MAPPPPYPSDPRWYGRYWRYTNRPRPGCGCLYMLVALLMIWWLLALLFPPLGWRYWWPGPVSGLQQSPVHKLVSAPVSQKERSIHSIWDYRAHLDSEVYPPPWSAPGQEALLRSSGNRGSQA